MQLLYAIPTRPRPGFTLVELLVVLAIMAVAVAVLLPALSHVRKAAQAAGCGANLHTLSALWQSSMVAYDYQIPHTQSFHLQPNWIDYLDAMAGDVPSFYGTNTTPSIACPEALRRYVPLRTHAPRWGYAVNIAWGADGDALNELKNWDAIRQPSRYPWFLDAEAYRLSLTSYSLSMYAPNPKPYLPFRGVGPHHGNGRVANVAFADGSVRGVAVEQTLGAGPGDYAWFENR